MNDKYMLKVMRLSMLCLIITMYCVNAQAWADANAKHPIIDRTESKYVLPNDLSGWSLAQLNTEKATREKSLKDLQNKLPEPEGVRALLLKNLLSYDDIRLRISGVLSELISNYPLDEKFKKQLLGFRDTFDTQIKPVRATVHSLEDYRAYDFQFSAVYMAMVFSFREHPEFNEKMLEDMKNENTAIGKYKKDLDVSYQEVEKTRLLMKDVHAIDELKESIKQIDQEIADRSSTAGV